METTYNSFFAILNNVVANTAAYLPRIGAAIVIFIIGWILARIIAGAIAKLLQAVLGSSVVKQAPVEHFFGQDELGHKLEEVFAKIVYWLAMLVVIHTTVSVLGLTSLTILLEQVINYIPNIIAAFLVFIFGVILAGLVERLVKSAVRSIDGQKDNRSSLVAGKLASYFVFSIASLAAISELGIAREFILVLFVGLVAMFSLGFALAIGLGSKEIINKMLKDWYEQTRTKQ